MAYSEEIKEEVKKRLAKGEKPKQISEQTGVSVPTIYNWKRQFEQFNQESIEKCEEEKISKMQEKVITEDKQVQQYCITATEKEQEENKQSIGKQENNTNSQFQNEKKNFKERIRVEQNTSNIENSRDNMKKISNRYLGIMDFLLEKRNDIYAKMQSENYNIQKEGISQWDLMEGLIEKVNKNKDDKQCINQLYEKILQLKEKENGMNR
ncbi:MAG: helix-turn-helix domain-containing protein [Clostridia bacterium]|nr:helix-turn-helix domain-containing protein [Clostridia bacterium]